jgi:hypothetical protein
MKMKSEKIKNSSESSSSGDDPLDTFVDIPIVSRTHRSKQSANDKKTKCKS